jgi:carbonic anhydrase
MRIKAEDGTLLRGWHYLPDQRTGKVPTVVMAHGFAPADVDALAIADPHKAVAVDVAALKANPLLPGGFLVIGLVYDVPTGRIEIVVPPSLLRPENPA